MHHSYRDETLELLNKTQQTLDEIFYALDEDKDCCTEEVLTKMETITTKVALVRSDLNSLL